MTLHFNIIQNTSSWMDARGGLATSSAFGRIITPSGNKSTQMDDYATQVALELVLGRSIDRDISNMYQIQWGNEYEGKAADLYQFETGYDLEHGGFFCDDHFKRGASPDAIVIENGEQIGLVEIKCPENPIKHGGFMFKRTINKTYKPQLFGQMIITGFEWVDYFSFYPELPHVKIRTRKESDMEFYRKLESLLDEFADLVQEKLESMVRCGHINEVPVKFIEPTKETIKPDVPNDVLMGG